MRKLLITGLLLASATAAAAQTSPAVRQDNQQDVAKDRQDNSGDRQDIRQDRQQLHQADVRRLKGLRQERVEHHQELQQNARELRADQHDQNQDRDAWRRAHRTADRDGDADREGLRLKPNFYTSRYYFNDFGRLGLPAPGPNQRWVRHDHDLVLVNVRNGMVLRVLHNKI